MTFVLDAHLGGLAASLRMLGFDTLWQNDLGDDELARISREEGRILLTRDRPLLERRDELGDTYRVETETTQAQLEEVVRHFGLLPLIRPFTRCMKCNGVLRTIAKDLVRSRVLDDTFRVFDEFFECPDCGRVYWKGSHYDRMREKVDGLGKN